MSLQCLVVRADEGVNQPSDWQGRGDYMRASEWCQWLIVTAGTVSNVHPLTLAH